MSQFVWLGSVRCFDGCPAKIWWVWDEERISKHQSITSYGRQLVERCLNAVYNFDGCIQKTSADEKQSTKSDVMALLIDPKSNNNDIKCSNTVATPLLWTIFYRSLNFF